MTPAKSLKKIIASIILFALAFTGLVTSNAAPANAAINRASEVIFFDQGAGHLGIKRMKFDGTGKSTYDISALISAPDIRTMISDGSKLYFVNNGDGVYSMNLDGTALAKISSAVPSDIVVYGNKIYYTLWSGGVSSMNLDGTGATSLAARTDFPGSPSGFRNLYVDSTYLWVTQGTGGGGTDGHVYRVALAGGTPSLAYTDALSAGVNGIAGDGDNIFIRSGNNGKVLGLSRALMTAGTQTVPSSEIYSNNQGSEVEFAGGKLYVTTNADIIELDLVGYDRTSPAIISGTSLNLNSAFTAANPRSMTVFAAKTVSFDANGGSGTMLSQSSAFDITLNPNSFIRERHVFAYWYTNNTCSSGGTLVNGGAQFSPTADMTLFACWRGKIEVSLTNGGATIDAYDFGSVVVGSTQSVTLYLSNVGALDARSLSFSNASVSTGVGLSLPGSGTCNFSGGSLNVGTPCTTTVTWSPVSAVTLHSNSESLVFQASANYAIGFSGSAVALKSVTFNANSGLGSMANQTGIVSQALTLSSLTRTGYTFAGWNTQADGLGTTYADGANYAFSNSISLYAQWTLIPVPVVTSPTFPQLTSVSATSFTEGEPQQLTLEGQRFDGFIEARVNGNPVKLVASENSWVTLDLGGLKSGLYTLVLKFKSGSLVYQDAFRVKAKSATPAAANRTQASKLVVGFAGDSALLNLGIKAQTLNLLNSIAAPVALTCTGSTSNNKITMADRALAKARARAICAFAKSQMPGISTKVQLNPSSGVGAKARNVLLQLTN